MPVSAAIQSDDMELKAVLLNEVFIRLTEAGPVVGLSGFLLFSNCEHVCNEVELTLC